MTTQNIEKRYILIHFYNSNPIILMVNDFAMDYIITHSHEIESMEYIDLVIQVNNIPANQTNQPSTSGWLFSFVEHYFFFQNAFYVYSSIGLIPIVSSPN